MKSLIDIKQDHTILTHDEKYKMLVTKKDESIYYWTDSKQNPELWKVIKVRKIHKK